MVNMTLSTEPCGTCRVVTAGSNSSVWHSRHAVFMETGSKPLPLASGMWQLRHSSVLRPFGPRTLVFKCTSCGNFKFDRSTSLALSVCETRVTSSRFGPCHSVRALVIGVAIRAARSAEELRLQRDRLHMAGRLDVAIDADVIADVHERRLVAGAALMPERLMAGGKLARVPRLVGRNRQLRRCLPKLRKQRVDGRRCQEDQ